ncbi:hypothetical protein [uncultured Mediterranean phage uvMED]|nr:hypothetical protein [uncultured Mediterranean phage uvMED]BAR17802.1 hypothetical protein [uncultured Mediterranean phage uvMED]|tara:strand:- start:162 stop:347 length:186 start_codon:yes stop_codon:yes gene_type:complete
MTVWARRNSIRGQDRYRDRRTDVNLEYIDNQDGTSLLQEDGHNLMFEQAVGRVHDGAAIEN